MIAEIIKKGVHLYGAPLCYKQVFVEKANQSFQRLELEDGLSSPSSKKLTLPIWPSPCLLYFCRSSGLPQKTDTGLTTMISTVG